MAEIFVLQYESLIDLDMFHCLDDGLLGKPVTALQWPMSMLGSSASRLA